MYFWVCPKVLLGLAAARQSKKIINPQNSEMFIDAQCKYFMYFVTADGDCSHSQADFPFPRTDGLGQCALIFRYVDFLILDQEGLA